MVPSVATWGATLLGPSAILTPWVTLWQSTRFSCCSNRSIEFVLHRSPDRPRTISRNCWLDVSLNLGFTETGKHYTSVWLSVFNELEQAHGNAIHDGGFSA